MIQGQCLDWLAWCQYIVTGRDRKFDLQLLSLWQHVQLSEQICPWDALACCWDIKQLTNNKNYSPWFLNMQAACRVYLQDKPTQAIFHAATQRQKLQIELAIWFGQRIHTPGQSVLAYCQAPGIQSTTWSSTTSSRTVPSGGNRDTSYGRRMSQPPTSCGERWKTCLATPNSWQHVDWGPKHGWSTTEEEEEEGHALKHDLQHSRWILKTLDSNSIITSFLDSSFMLSSSPRCLTPQRSNMLTTMADKKPRKQSTAPEAQSNIPHKTGDVHGMWNISTTQYINRQYHGKLYYLKMRETLDLIQLCTDAGQTSPSTDPKCLAGWPKQYLFLNIWYNLKAVATENRKDLTHSI